MDDIAQKARAADQILRQLIIFVYRFLKIPHTNIAHL